MALPLGTAHVAREGKREWGDGDQTLFLLLFICSFFILPPPPPSRGVCVLQLQVGGGREGGEWELGTGTTIHGVCFFLQMIGGELLVRTFSFSTLLYRIATTCSPSPGIYMPQGVRGEGQKGNTSSRHKKGDLCTTLNSKKYSFFYLFLLPLPIRFLLLSAATASLPPWTGCVCPFVTKKGRRRGKGKRDFFFSSQLPSSISTQNINKKKNEEMKKKWT